MGIIDIKFNKINTNIAISCLDSSIKIYDIDTSTFLLIIQSKSTILNVKLWKIGKFSIWVTILWLPVIAVELLSLILFPKKKLKNLIQEKSFWLLLPNQTNLLTNSSLQETTTEMLAFSISVSLLFYVKAKRIKFPLLKLITKWSDLSVSLKTAPNFCQVLMIILLNWLISTAKQLPIHLKVTNNL